MVKDERIKSICDKLGFDPREYVPILSGTEDEREVNPFEILDTDELRYLLDSGYLDKTA